jgi:hypothetical protein
MEARTDALPSPHAAHVHEPVVAARRSGLEYIPYGVAMGSVATAVGALATERLGGATRIVVWSTVTTVLAVAAVLLAEPGLRILSRLFRASRNR